MQPTHRFLQQNNAASPHHATTSTALSAETVVHAPVPRARALPPQVRMRLDTTDVLGAAPQQQRRLAPLHNAAPLPPHMPHPGHRAEAQTFEIPTPAPLPPVKKQLGVLRRALHKLRPVKVESEQVADKVLAWLLDQRLVVVDARQSYFVTWAGQASSDRLDKLGFFSYGGGMFTQQQAQAVREVLAASWASQKRASHQAQSIEQLSATLRDALAES